MSEIAFKEVFQMPKNLKVLKMISEAKNSYRTFQFL